MENVNSSQNSVDDLAGKVFNINLNGPATDENSGKLYNSLTFLSAFLYQLLSFIDTRKQAKEVDAK
jgi:hypothetical protein